MTTIAEFLNRTSGNNSYGELYKEAGAVGEFYNTAKGAIEQGFNYAKKQYNNYKNYNNPSDESTKALIDNSLNWNTFNTATQNILNQDKYKPFAPIYSKLSSDPEVQKQLLGVARNSVYNAYKPQNGEWTKDIYDNMSQDFSDPKNINWKPGLQDSILSGSMKVLQNALMNNDDVLYDSVLGFMPDSPDKTALINSIKNDPNRRAQFISAMKPQLTEYFNTYGLDSLQYPLNQNILKEKVAPSVTPLVKNYSLADSDVIPNDINNPVPEHIRLNTSHYGNNPVFNGLQKKYYSADDPNNGAKALIGFIKQFKDQDLRTAMIDNWSQLPPEKQTDAGYVHELNGIADLLERTGRTEKAQKIRDWISAVPKKIGTKGERLATSEAIGDSAIEELNPIFDELEAEFGDTDLWKETMSMDPYDGLSDEQRQEIHNYVQSLRDNPWDDGYYGFLKDPNIRRAVQYAAPWLMYGLPLAGIGSMMGTNSLWPLVLFGGLGSGVLGYGAKDWFKMNPETIQGMDNFFGTVNGPLGALGSMILPKSVSRDANNLLGVQNKQEAPATETSSAPANTAYYPPQNQNIIDVPSYSPTGTAYATAEDANRNATYYIPENRFARVGSQRV